ncbi:Ficolin-1 [Bulinus truncatus]|nr:Ficolin-1 [Bulinus truncatus]
MERTRDVADDVVSGKVIVVTHQRNLVRVLSEHVTQLDTDVPQHPPHIGRVDGAANHADQHPRWLIFSAGAGRGEMETTKVLHQRFQRTLRRQTQHLWLYSLKSQLSLNLYVFLERCGECRRAMQWPSQYAKLYSKNLKATFLCDTRTDGGGWILIQRRLYKTTSFKRDWNEYKNGFGSICEDYWLGNENIFRITNSGPYELRIDMVYNGKKFYAQYTEFYIDGEGNNYRLRIKGFTKGNVRDDFYRHNNMQFSTHDRDNDVHQTRHCAGYYGAGWWYHGCHSNNLNGVFNVTKYFGFSVSWESVTGNYKSVESVEMKIRKLSRPLMV